jgi:hypothetical protein
VGGDRADIGGNMETGKFVMALSCLLLTIVSGDGETH